MVNMAEPQIVLASSSPRRRELLDQVGVRYRVQVADIDESPQPNETPEALVCRLALEKAQAVWKQQVVHDEKTGQSVQRLPVLGADTLGMLAGDLLVKPTDFAAARDMLRRMSGQCHEVLTAVALVTDKEASVHLNTSQVWFRTLTDEEIAAYWATGEPVDKAGAYAIQGLGAIFVERMTGSYSAVTGLPLFETAQLLTDAGLALLDSKE